MTMMRWNPWSVSAPFGRGLDRFFEPTPAPAWWRNAGNLRIDVEDSPDGYTLTASLPGFEPGDVDISITGRTVTVSAESKAESESTTDKADDAYVLHERYSGSLIRRLILPGAVDATSGGAKFKNGVLTIRLPKASGSETHKVEIGAGA